MDSTLSALAHSPKSLPSFSRKRDGFNRNDIVDAFVQAFEMIGGIQALAIWGNANRTEFYRLYAKLLPATSLQIGEVGTINLIHSLPPGALDVHPPIQHPALVIDHGTIYPAAYTPAIKEVA